MTRQLCSHSIVLALAALVALAALAGAAGPAEGGDGLARPELKSEQPARARFQLPKLFDFELYKRVFGRTYSSAMEEAVRRKFMLARAMRAFISAIKYKLNQASSFSALNLFSDRLPAELDQDDNKHALDKRPARPGELQVVKLEASDEQLASQQRPALPEEEALPEIDPNEIERRLERLKAGDLEAVREEAQVGEQALDQVRAELAKQQRRKRDLRRPRHELDLERLISTGDAGVGLNAETSAKVEAFPESNNPLYRPLELPSEGVREEAKVEIKWYEMIVKPERELEHKRERRERLLRHLRDLKRSVRNSNESILQWLRDSVADWMDKSPREIYTKLGAWEQRLRTAEEAGASGEAELADQEAEIRKLLREKGIDPDADPIKPDEVFVDHRDSNCFFQPRSQGNCGSCYAFAAISMAEWLYCKQTGKLAAFSEQYMVDCGSTVGQWGCDGGDDWKAANFIHNYGMELRSHYPYVARNQTCPYDEHTHPEQMGFIRLELHNMLSIPMAILGDQIHVSPASVQINSPRSFKEYGGGVWKGEDCDPNKNFHAVVIIGHGREDGLEYWLIRNSHSLGWGEQGHMKVWKGAPCFPEGYASLFAFQDVRRKWTLKVAPNAKNRRSPVKRLYGRNLRRELREHD